MNPYINWNATLEAELDELIALILREINDARLELRNLLQWDDDGGCQQQYWETQEDVDGS